MTPSGYSASCDRYQVAVTSSQLVYMAQVEAATSATDEQINFSTKQLPKIYSLFEQRFFLRINQKKAKANALPAT